MADFELAVERVISFAGAGDEVCVDRQSGEVSRYGISLKVAMALGACGACKAADDAFIRHLSLDSAHKIYFDYFWSPLLLSGLKHQDVTKLLDMAVLVGHERAIRIWQEALNSCGARVSVDGRMSTYTLQATNEASAFELMLELRAILLGFYHRLTERNPEKYGPRWATLRARAER